MAATVGLQLPAILAQDQPPRRVDRPPKSLPTLVREAAGDDKAVNGADVARYSDEEEKLGSPPSDLDWRN